MKFIQNSDVLLGHGNSELRNVALDIVEYALSVVDPYFAVKQLVHLKGKRLTVGNLVLDLSQVKSIYVLGAGKATLRIAEAIEDILGNRIDGGLIAIKRGQPHNLRYVRVIEAAHPIPDKASFQAAKEALALANRAQAGDVIFTATTGGSSALLCYPPDNISFEEKQQVHELLLGCGADIVEINAVRKHLSRVKGGLLAQAALPAQLINLTVSDVVGDHLDYIAGPVVPDTSYLTDAIAVLKKYDLWNRVAPSVREHLGKGPSVETPKKLDGKLVHSFVVVPSAAAAKAACIRAKELGFRSLLLTTYLEGESREAAVVVGSIVQEIVSTANPIPVPCALIASGENTVMVENKNGIGGPSQEFALSIATRIDGLSQVVAACLDTDGSDGPTEFAGALVDGLTASSIRDLGRDAFSALKTHTATPLLEELGDLVYTGATGTNVSDLRVILIGRNAHH
jgi:glycerate-2-kinase